MMPAANDKSMIALLGKVRGEVTRAMDPTPAPVRNSIISGGRLIRK